jgi:hypothetical protein
MKADNFSNTIRPAFKQKAGRSVYNDVSSQSRYIAIFMD